MTMPLVEVSSGYRPPGKRCPKRAYEAPIRLRRRQSDAKWRANVASCYETLKHIIPHNKRASKRQISKALVLEESARHIHFLEGILLTLLHEKYKQTEQVCSDEAIQDQLDWIKHNFVDKQQQMMLAANSHKKYKKSKCSKQNLKIMQMPKEPMSENQTAEESLGDSIITVRLQSKTSTNSSDDMSLTPVESVYPSNHITDISSYSMEPVSCDSHVTSSDDSNNDTNPNTSKLSDAGKMIGPVMVSILKAPAVQTSELELDGQFVDTDGHPNLIDQAGHNISAGYPGTPIKMHFVSTHPGQVNDIEQHAPQKHHALLWLTNTSTKTPSSAGGNDQNSAVSGEDAVVPDFTPIKQASSATKSNRRNSHCRQLGFTPVKLPVGDQDAPCWTPCSSSADALVSNPVLSESECSEDECASLLCFESMENMDLEEDIERTEQTPSNCQRRGRQKFTKVSKRKHKHSKASVNRENASSSDKLVAQPSDEAAIQTDRQREQPRCRKQLNMDCAVDLQNLTLHCDGADPLPSSELLLETVNCDHQEFDGFMVFYKQTVSQLEPFMATEDLHSSLMMETVSKMWQEMMSDERQAFIAMAAVENNSQHSTDKNLSDDLKDVSVSPIARLEKDSSSVSLDRALQELLQCVELPATGEVHEASEECVVAVTEETVLSPGFPQDDCPAFLTSCSQIQAPGTEFLLDDTGHQGELCASQNEMSQEVSVVPCVLLETDLPKFPDTSYSMVPVTLKTLLVEGGGADTLSQQVVPSVSDMETRVVGEQQELVIDSNTYIINTSVPDAVDTPLSPWRSSTLSSIEGVSDDYTASFWLSGGQLLES